MCAFAGEASVNFLQVAQIPDAIAVFDTEMRCLACSPRWRDEYLLDGRNSIGHSNSAICSEVPVTLRAKFQRAMAGELVVCDAELLQRSNGSQHYVRMVICPWCNQDGKVRKVIISAEQLNMKDKYTSAEVFQAEYFRSVLEIIPDAMVAISEDGTIQSFNSSAEAVFGYKQAEVLGQNFSIILEPHASRDDCHLTCYEATDTPPTSTDGLHILARRNDGSTFPCLLHISETLVDEKLLLVCFARDLTDHEEAKSKLKELQTELTQIARGLAVGTMATALAHELNQPLTAIANYVQTSAKIIESENAAAIDLVGEALKQAGEEALRAGTIIRRIRDFLSRGDLELSIIRPKDLVQNAYDLGSIGGRFREISFKIEISEDLAFVLVDRVQIEQVLLNLIQNASDALEHQGNITITAIEDGEMIQFTITDDGPGIEHGKEEAVFETFTSSKANGMGMGLAICRTIIEANGGCIWCEADRKSGASFHFTVPRAEVKGE